MTFRQYPPLEGNFTESFVVAEPEISLSSSRVIRAGAGAVVQDTGTEVIISTFSGSASGAAANAAFLVWNMEPSLSQSRVVTVTTGLTLTNNGTNVVLGTDSTLVTLTGTQTLTNKTVLQSVVSTAIDYGVTATDKYIFVSCTGGPRVVTLPSAGAQTGKEYTVKKVDATNNTVTITSPSLIDGVSSFALLVMNDSVDMVSDGTVWRLI